MEGVLKKLGGMQEIKGNVKVIGYSGNEAVRKVLEEIVKDTINK